MAPQCNDSLNALQFSSLTFMFFPKLKKASAATHPKGLRKVKITLKYWERKWVSGEECTIIYIWIGRWGILMLHLIRFRTKFKLQSFRIFIFTFSKLLYANTVCDIRAIRTYNTAFNQDKRLIQDDTQKEQSGHRNVEVKKKIMWRFGL